MFGCLGLVHRPGALNHLRSEWCQGHCRVVFRSCVDHEVGEHSSVFFIPNELEEHSSVFFFPRVNCGFSSAGPPLTCKFAEFQEGAAKSCRLFAGFLKSFCHT